MIHRHLKSFLLATWLVSFFLSVRVGADVAPPRLLHTFVRGEGNDQINSLDYSMDGRKILIGHNIEGEIFDANTFESLGRFPLFYRALFEPSTRQILSLDENDHFGLFDVLTGEKVWSPRDSRFCIGTATFSPNGRYLIGLCDDNISTISIWDWTTKKKIGEFECMPFMNPLVEFTPDEKQLIILGSLRSAYYGVDRSRDRIRIYDIETKELREFPISLPKPLDPALAVFPEGEAFLCSAERTLYKCRYPSGEILESFPLPFKEGYLMGLERSPTGRFLLIGNSDLTSQILDTVSKTVVWEFKDTNPYFTTTNRGFSPDGRRVLLSSKDRKELRVWDINGLYDPAEETPTAIPLPPTPTPTPADPYTQPNYPNLNAEFISLYDTTPNYSWSTPQFTTDTRNGDLYARIVKNRYFYEDVIVGPIHPDRPVRDVREAPVYARIPYPHSLNAIRGLLMTRQGRLYFAYDDHLLVVSQTGLVKEILYAGSRAYELMDLYEAREGDLIPGAKPGDLICLARDTQTERHGIKVFKLDPNAATPEMQVIAETDRWAEPHSLTLGPDHRLCIMEGCNILRLEENGTFTGLFYVNPIGSQGDFRYWPKDHSFYGAIHPHGFLWRICIDGSFSIVANFKEGTFNDVELSPDGETLYFISTDALDRFPPILAALTMREPFPVDTASAYHLPTPLPVGHSTATPTPTQTETVLPTPTPFPSPSPTVTPPIASSPTMTPTPVISPVSTFASPDLEAQFIAFYNETDPAIAVDPRNQDIYLYHNGDDRHPVIRGPIPRGRVLSETETAPIYAELPYHSDCTQSTRGFAVTAQGVMFIEYGGTIYRIPKSGVVEPFYPQSGSTAEYGDVYVVRPGDRIPGAGEGDVILLKYGGINLGQHYFTLLRLDSASLDPQPQPIVSGLLPTFPDSLSSGPGGYLYLTGLLYRSTPFCFIYRLETNGSFTRMLQAPNGVGKPNRMEYWPKDQSFILYSEDWQALWRFPSERMLPELNFANEGVRNFDLEPYGNGERMLMMDCISVANTPVKFLQAVSLKESFSTPTPPGSGFEFPTPLPADYPTATPIPSPTPTLKVLPAGWEPGYGSVSLLTNTEHQYENLCLATHPHKPGWYGIESDFTWFRPLIVRYSFSENPSGTISFQRNVVNSLWFRGEGYISNFGIGSDGTAVVLAWFPLLENPALFLVRPSGEVVSAEIDFQGHPPTIHSLFVVTDTTKIPFARPGDILIGNRLLRMPQESNDRFETEVTALPDSIFDFTEGPAGRLFFLYRDKIHLLGENGEIREWMPYEFSKARQIAYNALDASFYLTLEETDLHGIVRVSALDQSISRVGRARIFSSPSFSAAPGQPGVYVLCKERDNQDTHVLHVFPQPSLLIPTTTPTSTPIPGWFVLDGFGGIHSTNAKIRRPVLPYIDGFNIIRDLEPDPLGRGWYMLDGFGGVHTSSPDLPLPRGLPYFPGFDIARNLEVRLKGNRLEFYLLDGFGTVHSTDPDFAYGRLPWFGWDIAQDLDYSPEDGAWRVLDRFGLLFRSDGPQPELPLGEVFAIPGAKSLVRFGDGTSVLLDAFGGRHTDPSHPARDVLDGLPRDFYFPGWDIIWDAELVPETWAKNE